MLFDVRSVASCRWAGDDEKINVVIAVIARLMFRSGRNFDPAPRCNMMQFTLQLHRELAVKNVEELTRL